MKHREHHREHIDLEDALMEFRHTMTSLLMEEAKKKGCSVSHFEVLKYIVEKGNPSMTDIAKKLHITPPSASMLVDSMVAKKFVIRQRTPQDRRTVRILLAPKGHMLLSSVHKKKSSVFTKMLSKLPHRDRAELARMLVTCISK